MVAGTAMRDCDHSQDYLVSQLNQRVKQAASHTDINEPCLADSSRGNHGHIDELQPTLTLL